MVAFEDGTLQSGDEIEGLRPSLACTQNPRFHAKPHKIQDEVDVREQCLAKRPQGRSVCLSLKYSREAYL